jgi:MFS family permease
MTTGQAGSPPRSEPLVATEGSANRVFAVVGLAVFLATLDLFIVNIAVPAIQDAFPGTTVADVSWVLSGYAIVFAALLVPAGKLGDVIGRRRVFMLGVFAFGLGSGVRPLPRWNFSSAPAWFRLPAPPR